MAIWRNRFAFVSIPLYHHNENWLVFSKHSMSVYLYVWTLTCATTWNNKIFLKIEIMTHTYIQTHTKEEKKTKKNENTDTFTNSSLHVASWYHRNSSWRISKEKRKNYNTFGVTIFILYPSSLCLAINFSLSFPPSFSIPNNKRPSRKAERRFYF